MQATANAVSLDSFTYFRTMKIHDLTVLEMMSKRHRRESKRSEYIAAEFSTGTDNEI